MVVGVNHCFTGNTSSSKVSFVTDVSQQVVFASDEPSVLVTYDKMLRAHSVWAIRCAKSDVSNAFLSSKTPEERLLSDLRPPHYVPRIIL